MNLYDQPTDANCRLRKAGYTPYGNHELAKTRLWSRRNRDGKGFQVYAEAAALAMLEKEEKNRDV